MSAEQDKGEDTAMYQRSMFILEASESQLCDYGLRLTSDYPTTAVRFVRGKKMRKVDSLFDEVSAACQFPYYFGENWPAFAECLGDLTWLNSSAFILIISDFEEILADEEMELGALGRALASAVDEFNRSNKNTTSHDSSMQLIFNCKLDGIRSKRSMIDEIGKPTILKLNA